jgi:hypothetical protein
MNSGRDGNHGVAETRRERKAGGMKEKGERRKEKGERRKEKGEIANDW